MFKKKKQKKNQKKNQKIKKKSKNLKIFDQKDQKSQNFQKKISHFKNLLFFKKNQIFLKLKISKFQIVLESLNLRTRTDICS